MEEMLQNYTCYKSCTRLSNSKTRIKCCLFSKKGREKKNKKEKKKTKIIP